MVKKCLWLTAVLVLCFTCTALAAGMGDPIKITEAGKFTVSIEDNFIFKKNMDSSGDITGGKMKDTNQVYGKVNYAVLDNLDLYGKIGAANLEQEINWNVNRTQTLKFNYGLLAGGGIRAHYPIYKEFGLGGDVQFNWWYSKLDKISGDNNPFIVDKGSYNNFEGQATLYLDYTYALADNIELVPYAGVYYSYFKSITDKTIKFQDNAYIYTHGDMKSSDPVGPIVGLDLVINKNISLNLEGRFVSETAITGGCSYKF